MSTGQSDGERALTYMYVTVVSVYAPTFRAPVEEKFYSDLQESLDEVSEYDLLLLVGDFSGEWAAQSAEVVEEPGVE